MKSTPDAKKMSKKSSKQTIIKQKKSNNDEDNDTKLLNELLNIKNKIKINNKSKQMDKKMQAKQQNLLITNSNNSKNRKRKREEIIDAIDDKTEYEPDVKLRRFVKNEDIEEKKKETQFSAKREAAKRHREEEGEINYIKTNKCTNDNVDKLLIDLDNKYQMEKLKHDKRINKFDKMIDSLENNIINCVKSINNVF